MWKQNIFYKYTMSIKVHISTPYDDLYNFSDSYPTSWNDSNVFSKINSLLVFDNQCICNVLSIKDRFLGEWEVYSGGYA